MTETDSLQDDAEVIEQLHGHAAVTAGQDIDFPLLWKVYDHILLHPHEWDQSTWVYDLRARDDGGLGLHDWAQRHGVDITDCGTVFCFAGHTVNIAIVGARFLRVKEWAELMSDEGSEEMQMACMVETPGGLDSISDLAAMTLGLNPYQRSLLFSGGNSLEDIHLIISTWERQQAELENDLA